MRIILHIFAVSMFLTSCQEVTIDGVRQSGRMVFSDALPVQWWLANCDTYNEYTPKGVHYVCWCHPWDCDVPIVVQFKETTGGDYSLKAISSNADESTQLFDEVLPGVYQTSFTPSDNSPDFCHGKIKLQVIDNSTLLVMAKTDCIDVRLTHDDLTIITYYNNRNFAGLVYEDQSPDLTLSICVPSRFYHAREVEEDSAIELTSQIVTTSSQLKIQRLLEVKSAPHFFHKKMILVLKHSSVAAIDKSWKKEEKYDKPEGNKRWPLKQATVYLTEANSVIRNVL